MPIQKITTGVVDASVFSSPTISGNLSLDSTGTTGVRSPAANTLTFHTAGTEDMRIDSAGNVGIGATSLSDKLTIAHADEKGITFKATGTDGTTAAQLFFEDTNGGTGGVLRFDHDVNSFTFATAGTTERMRIDSSGNLLFNSGYGSAATAYGCRAWVNFNGTGTVAIRGSGNVSSITDNGTGNYFINFASALTDANYSVTGIGGHIVGVVTTFSSVREGTRTTSGVQVDYFTVSSTYYDTNDANIAVFR
jgi:hypothetical protein